MRYEFTEFEFRKFANDKNISKTTVDSVLGIIKQFQYNSSPPYSYIFSFYPQIKHDNYSFVKSDSFGLRFVDKESKNTFLESINQNDLFKLKEPRFNGIIVEGKVEDLLAYYKDLGKALLWDNSQDIFSVEIFSKEEDKMEVELEYFETLAGKMHMLNHRKIRLMEEFEMYEKYPLFKKNILPRKIEAIESLTREIDRETNMNIYRKQAHSLAIKIPTSEEDSGKIPGQLFSRFVSNLQAILDEIRMFLGIDEGAINISVAGLEFGSAILLTDIDAKDNEIKNKFEAQLKKTLESTDLLKSESKEEIPQKAEAFKAAIGLEGSFAFRVSEAIQNLTPPSEGYENIEFSIPSLDFTKKLYPSDKKAFSSVKQELKRTAIHKEGDIRTIRGELFLADELSSRKIHKFRIKPITGNSETVVYEATEEIDESVKGKLRENIAAKIRYDKGKWVFVNWVT